MTQLSGNDVVQEAFDDFGRFDDRLAQATDGNWFDLEDSDRIAIYDLWKKDTDKKRRSDPEMNEQMVLIVDAATRHHAQGHNADFEVCQDVLCRLAYLLEVSLGWINTNGTYDESMQ